MPCELKETSKAAAEPTKKLVYPELNPETMKNSHSFRNPKEPALSPQHLSGPGPSGPWVAQTLLVCH